MIIPNFLIIGAARSGTTSLVHCLNLHHQIFLPETNKEPKYFSREQEFKKGVEYYLNTYFSSTDKYKAVGEKTTEYMENLSVAERIYHFNSNMKLICMLRNPVERVISNYWWSVCNGLEDRPINIAVETEYENYLNNPEKVTIISSVRPHEYIRRSLYYENLRPFYQLFSVKNIKCIIFEEFMYNKEKITEDIFKFLDVEIIDLPIDSIKIQRDIERSHTLDSQLYKILRDFFYRENEKLSELIIVSTAKWYD